MAKLWNHVLDKINKSTNAINYLSLSIGRELNEVLGLYCPISKTDGGNPVSVRFSPSAPLFYCPPGTQPETLDCD